MKKHGRYIIGARSVKVKVTNVYQGSKPVPGEWILLLVLEGTDKKRNHSIVKKNIESRLRLKGLKFEFALIA